MPELITEDVPRFWTAFEHLDDPNAAEHFQRLYLEPGSAGVRAFLHERIVSAHHLVGVVQSHQAFYESIRERSLATIQELRPRLEAVLRRFSEVVPGAPDTEVYFVIGALNSGGTFGHDGNRAFAVVGLEFFCREPTTSLHELNSWERSVLMTPDTLPGIVAHELIHTLQSHLIEQTPNLLLFTLAEGAADYLGHLVSGQVISPLLYEYGLAHEDELRARFQKDMTAGTGPGAWLYQGNKAQGEPADLGYFIGARIMRAYHERHRNKPDVIPNMLHRALLEPEAFIHESGYFD